MLGLYKFELDCGRQGFLSGVFIAEKEKVDYIISSGEKVVFGEVCGKHSWIKSSLDEGNIKLLTDDEDFILKCESFGLETGYNPVEFYEEREGSHYGKEEIDE